MEEDSKAIATYITHQGKFRPKFMHMGLMNVMATYQWNMDMALAGLA